MPTTITISGTLKRRQGSNDLFLICQKGIRKSGPSKRWTCTHDWAEERITLDFADGVSEPMTLQIQNGEISANFTVDYDVQDDVLDKKSFLFALMKLLYPLKKSCRELTITDTSRAYECFLEAMKYAVRLRPLTPAETARVQRLAAEQENYQGVLLEWLREDLGVPKNADIKAFLNDGSLFGVERSVLPVLLETWLCRTCTYKNEARVSELTGEGMLGDFDDLTLNTAAYVDGVAELIIATRVPTDTRCFGVPHGLVRRLLRERVLPELLGASHEDAAVLCCRAFWSILEFANFQFVGLPAA